MEYREIIFEQKGPVAFLTLNRPDTRNALTDAGTMEGILDVCRKVQDSDDIGVLILTGTGSAFSSGGNIKDLQKKEGMFSGDPLQLRENYRKGIQRVPLALYHLDVPTIAAVNGPAIGAGCDLACMCDIRIAAEEARFGEPFVSMGLVPGDGGTFFLPHVVGFAKAAELIFTCRIIDAYEALRIGLVNEVTPQERLLERCTELAMEIARQPWRTLRTAKRLLALSRGKTLEEVLELSAAFQGLCHHTPEHHQALDHLSSRKK